MVHQVRQTHDAQPDAPGALGGFLQLRHRRDVLVGVHHVVQEARGAGDVLAQLSPVHAVVLCRELRQVDRSQAAVFVRTKELLAAGVGGFQLVQMRDRVAAVGGIQEQHARLAVVVCLAHDLVEQVARPHALVNLDGDAGFLGLLDVAVEAAVLGVGHIREFQVPAAVVLHRSHEGIGDAHRDVEVGDLVLVGLAGDEFLDIRMVHAQHRHVGAAACSALRHLAEGVVVYAQEAHRAGRLPGGGLDQRALGAQAGEVESVAAAGLLDEGGVAQRLEDAAGALAHIVGEREHKARRQLPQRGAGAGEGWGIGEEGLGGQHPVVGAGGGVHVAEPQRFHLGNVRSHAPEHLLDRFRRLLVVVAAHVAPDEHLAGILGQLHAFQVGGHGRCVELETKLLGCFGLHVFSH